MQDIGSYHAVRKGGWTYSLELTDVNTPSVIIAALDEVEVEK